MFVACLLVCVCVWGGRVCGYGYMLAWVRMGACVCVVCARLRAPFREVWCWCWRLIALTQLPHACACMPDAGCSCLMHVCAPCCWLQLSDQGLEQIADFTAADLELWAVAMDTTQVQGGWGGGGHGHHTGAGGMGGGGRGVTYNPKPETLLTTPAICPVHLQPYNHKP